MIDTIVQAHADPLAPVTTLGCFGALARMAPRARIVWCRRNPLDTCLSRYFQSFAEGQPFAYDLEDLGLVHRLHERSMRHWQRVLPNPIIELSYEQLVREPLAEAERLVAFAGLPWQPSCLATDDNRRPIRTSSLWQAREPVHCRSIARWQKYARHLEPLRRALDLFDLDSETVTRWRADEPPSAEA